MRLHNINITKIGKSYICYISHQEKITFTKITVCNCLKSFGNLLGVHAVHCNAYFAYCTAYFTLYCILYCMQYTVPHTVQNTVLHTVHCTAYFILYCIQYTVLNIYYTAFITLYWTYTVMHTLYLYGWNIDFNCLILVQTILYCIHYTVMYCILYCTAVKTTPIVNWWIWEEKRVRKPWWWWTHLQKLYAPQLHGNKSKKQPSR